MLQTTCDCGRTMRANTERAFVEQVSDHLKHNHPEQAESSSAQDILDRVEQSAPRASVGPMFETICECGAVVKADSEQAFGELVMAHMRQIHPELAEGMSAEDVLVWWGSAFAPKIPYMDQDAVGIPPGADRRLMESKLTESGTFAFLDAITELGLSERMLIDTLISWGLAYDDVEGLDDIDEAVLRVLINARGEQPLPNSKI